MRVVTGVDVSHHQDTRFDPSKLSSSVEWCCARSTYGVARDRQFLAHVTKARLAGLKVGAYHFLRQIQGAEEQWAAWRDAMDEANLGADDLAPVVDLEWNERFDGKVDPGRFNDRGEYLARKARDAFGECTLYLAPGFFQTLGKPEWALEYPWWIAHYNVEKPWNPFREHSAWQFGTFQSKAYPTPIDGNTGSLPLATKTPPWEIDTAAHVPISPATPLYAEDFAAELTRRAVSMARGHDPLDRKSFDEWLAYLSVPKP
jgi:GH25 family lysozyme M1 (1,4-beta-N-acetylmuramidase)